MTWDHNKGQCKSKNSAAETEINQAWDSQQSWTQ